jgi:hypothetical protein
MLTSLMETQMLKLDEHGEGGDSDSLFMVDAAVAGISARYQKR